MYLTINLKLTLFYIFPVDNSTKNNIFLYIFSLNLIPFYHILLNTILHFNR